MRKLGLIIFTVLYYSYIAIISITFEVILFLFVILLLLFKKGCFDDAMRIHNQIYGRFLVRMSFPIIRVARKGLENVPPQKPYVLVFNHRSYTDIFFCTLFPAFNIAVFIRSWPFKIPGLNIFMRLAKYINIEDTSIHDFMEKSAKRLIEKKAIFLFFPEGHRSKDGKLQHFHSGAFLLASEYNLPIVPICLSGTEKLAPVNSYLISPAKIVFEILPPVYPDKFPPDNKTIKIKKHVETMFREYFGEIN